MAWLTSRIGSRGLIASVSLWMTASTTWACLQPPPPPGGGEPGQREATRTGEPPREPENLREIIARRLDEARRTQEFLDSLLKEVDAGGDMEALRRKFEEHRQERRGNARREGNPGNQGPEHRPMPGDGPNQQPGAKGIPMAGPGSEPLNGRFEFAPFIGGPKLSPEEREKVRAMIREHAPKIADRIDELAGKNPEAADRLTDGLGNRMRGLLAVRERDPQEFKLRISELSGTLDILGALRKCNDLRKNKAPDADINAARAELRTAMSNQFDIRMDLIRQQINQLRSQADHLQKDLDKTQADREKIVDEKTNQLLNPPERKRKPEGEKPKQP